MVRPCIHIIMAFMNKIFESVFALMCDLFCSMVHVFIALMSDSPPWFMYSVHRCCIQFYGQCGHGINIVFSSMAHVFIALSYSVLWFMYSWHRGLIQFPWHRRLLRPYGSGIHSTDVIFIYMAHILIALMSYSVLWLMYS